MAAVIDARVQQAGKAPDEETALERAQRLEHELVFKEERQAFLNSQKGVRSAQSELAKLFNDIDRISNEINKTTRKISIHLDRDEKHLILSAHGLSLDVTWVLRSPNTLEKSALHVMLWKGLLSVHGAAFEKPRRLEKAEFRFDRNSVGEAGWHESEREDRFLSSAELAEGVCESALGSPAHGSTGRLNYKKKSHEATRNSFESYTFGKTQSLSFSFFENRSAPWRPIFC